MRRTLKHEKPSVYTQPCAAGHENLRMKRSERDVHAFATSLKSPEEVFIIGNVTVKGFFVSEKKSPVLYMSHDNMNLKLKMDK